MRFASSLSRRLFGFRIGLDAKRVVCLGNLLERAFERPILDLGCVVLLKIVLEITF